MFNADEENRKALADRFHPKHGAALQRVAEIVAMEVGAKARDYTAGMEAVRDYERKPKNLAALADRNHPRHMEVSTTRARMTEEVAPPE